MTLCKPKILLNPQKNPETVEIIKAGYVSCNFLKDEKISSRKGPELSVGDTG